MRLVVGDDGGAEIVDVNGSGGNGDGEASCLMDLCC